MGRSLKGHVVALTQRDGAFDRALADGFAAAGARVFDEPAPDAPDADAAAAWLHDAAAACRAPVDILVNNRRRRHLADAETLAFAEWRETQAYVLDSAFTLTTAFARQQIDGARAGTVLSLADALLMETSVGAAGTGAASAALATLTRGWAVEWAADGIRANVLAYAWWDEPGDQAAVYAIERGLDVAGTVPVGRVATMADIVAVALYLCSPYAAYVTGATLVVDGGEGLRHTLGGPPFRAPRDRLPATAPPQA